MVAVLAIPSTAQAAVTNVICDPVALQTAITSAASGDTLVLAPGCTYTYTDLNKATADNALPVINKTLTILGSGDTIQRASTAATKFRLFQIDNPGNLTLTNLTIRNGHSAGDGGGILLNGAGTALKASVVTVTNNFADIVGGGIADLGGAATFNSSTVTSNTAGLDGGGFFVTGPGATGTFNSSSVVGNMSVGTGFAEGGGLEVLFGSKVTLNSTRVAGNTVSVTAAGGSVDGAGIAMNATVTLNSSPVENNTATGSGGGAEGGGVFNFGGTLNVTSSRFSGNTANDPVIGGKGGGLFNNGGGTATFRSSPVTGNSALGPTATAGGIFRASGTVTLISSPVTGNIPNNCGSPSTVPGCS
ncbi:hypothetical protein [Gandjariella thermophila]|nr:hypothetical protein [Gandjariella thermophila]